MFRRILIPTDGSAVSAKAVKSSVALAARLGASVVGYHAIEPIERLYYAEGRSARASAVKELQARLDAQGRGYLADLAKVAERAGVACETVITTPATAYQGIVETARRRKCDAIFMASHGRGPIGALLVGSVTQKVLAQSKLPVLVYR
jgi:nucleotide-binding universal stress UspA family protein